MPRLLTKHVLPRHEQAYDTSRNSSVLDYGVTQLQSDIHPVQGILIEVLLSMVLVTVFVHTTLEKSEFRPVAPVVIALALTAAVVSRYIILLYMYYVYAIVHV